VKLPALGLMLGSAAGLVAATQPLSDTDMWWHLATGRETLAHGLVRADIFSWTVNGTSVPTDQWLGQVVMYAAYTLLGWWGIALVRVISVVALISLVAINASVARSVRPLALALATLPALLLTRAIWVDRPELLGFVFFAALLLLLRVGRGSSSEREGSSSERGESSWGRGGSTWALGAAVGVIVVWANVHGSFALGVVITVLVCAEGALRDVPRRRAYLACAAATVLASFATPAGLGTWTAPGIHLLSPPRDIQEWNVVDVRTPLGVAYVVTLGLVIAAVALGPRVSGRELVVLIPVAFLSLTAARQAPLLAIAAAPLFAVRVDALIRARATALLGARATETLSTRGTPSLSRDGVPPLAGALGRAGSVSFAIAAMLVIASLAVAPRQPDERAYPVASSQSIPSGDGMLARYEWGGWLIWNGVRVYVDGRLTPYVGGVLDDYRRIIAAAPGWRDAIARRGVRALLVVPSDPVAIRALELGWSVRLRSKDFILIAVP